MSTGKQTWPILCWISKLNALSLEYVRLKTTWPERIKLSTRCVKCTKNQQRIATECIRSASELLYFCNCDKAGDPASCCEYSVYKKKIAWREAAKNRKKTGISHIKQTVAQQSQNLTSSGISYAQASSKIFPKVAVQPVPILSANAFCELLETLASAPTNEQSHYPAIKQIRNLWS